MITLQKLQAFNDEELTEKLAVKVIKSKLTMFLFIPHFIS